MERLTGRVRFLYAQQRAPIASLLVALITIASVLSYPPLQIAAAVALLGLILQMLFEIDGKVTGSKAAIWYPSYHAAVPSITEEIGRRLRRRPVTIRWIGVTLEAGWPFCQNIFMELFAEHFGKATSLHVELALVDPDGQVCQQPDGPAQGQVRSTIDRVVNFISSHDKQLTSHGSSINVYMYNYRPTWHGLLVDDDILFYSAVMPPNLRLASPQSGVEVVSLHDGEPNAERIRHFIACFEFIASDARRSGKVVSSQRATLKRK